jgi:hypothetical protein
MLHLGFCDASRELFFIEWRVPFETVSGGCRGINTLRCLAKSTAPSNTNRFG